MAYQSDILSMQEVDHAVKIHEIFDNIGYQRLDKLETWIRHPQIRENPNDLVKFSFINFGDEVMVPFDSPGTIRPIDHRSAAGVMILSPWKGLKTNRVHGEQS